VTIDLIMISSKLDSSPFHMLGIVGCKGDDRRRAFIPQRCVLVLWCTSLARSVARKV
jgi:hypothetical protein